MTRRKHPPPSVDTDDYGFNVSGKGFRVTPRELEQLLGQDTVTCALYMRCLKPFADRTGHVQNASYYRFLQLLKVVQSPCGGQRLPEPTLKQLRRALERLQQAGLITTYPDANRNERALQIRVQSASGRSVKA